MTSSQERFTDEEDQFELGSNSAHKKLLSSFVCGFYEDKPNK